jgi:glycerate 2-kinase
MAKLASVNELLLKQILKTGIDSINPRTLLKRYVNIVEQDQKYYLAISDPFSTNHQRNEFSFDKNSTYFELNQNVYVCAFGKAALAMSLEVEDILNSVSTHPNSSKQKPDLVKGISILPYSQIIGQQGEQTNWNFLSNGQIQLKSRPESKFEFYYGAKNNLPDKLSSDATRHILEMIQNIHKSATDSKTILLCLISGGGSALLSCPNEIVKNETCSDENDASRNSLLKLETIKRVVHSGANISELNIIRSCLSRVKAGNLAELALSSSPNSISIVSLIISDVIDDPLEIIASGPTILQENQTGQSKYSKALAIIEKYKLESLIPKEVIDYLSEMSLFNQILTEPKTKFDRNKVFNFLIGNNKIATQSMHSKLEQELNFDFCHVLTNSLDGEAKLVGTFYAFLAFSLISNTFYHSPVDFSSLKSKPIVSLLNAIGNDLTYIKLVESLFLKFSPQLESIKSLPRKKSIKVGLLSGGETTVNLSNCNNLGVGGRNLEMTLAFEYVFQGLIKTRNEDRENSKRNDFSVVFGSFGTDGIDGPTNAAGAYFKLDNESAISHNDDEMCNHLAKHDSYNYYLKHDRLLITGATGTNVSDVQVLLLSF